MTRRVSVVAAMLALAACKGPAVPNPMAGQTRYLCCNLHYEKTDISDVNYLRGTLIPVGTPLQVLEVRTRRVKFQPTGYPLLTLVLKHGRDHLSIEQYMNRLFLPEDPRTKLPRSRDKKQAANVARLIGEGMVEPGMTKDQVLMALGYPPAHRTPSLDGSTWTYWRNRWATMTVFFDGDKVSRVDR